VKDKIKECGLELDCFYVEAHWYLGLSCENMSERKDKAKMDGKHNKHPCK
jgi:hypothetical protein